MMEASTSIEGVAKSTDELARGAIELARSSQEGVEKLESLATKIYNVNHSAEIMEKKLKEVNKANEDGKNSIINLKKAVKLRKTMEELDKLINKFKI